MGLFDFFKSRKPKQSSCTTSSSSIVGRAIGVCDTPLNAKYTPETITSLGPRDIFVFGYSVRGHDTGSDARVALHRFGAVVGGADGLYGNSYAIPIWWDFDKIKPYIDKFIEFAEYEKALTFYVTKIGCEWCNIRKIAPLFRNAYHLPNVILPIEFARYIEEENRSIHPLRILDTMEAAHEERVKHFDSPIKVIGMGGGGSNSVERMIENPLDYVEYSILNTDIHSSKPSKVKSGGQLQGLSKDPCGIIPRGFSEE